MVYEIKDWKRVFHLKEAFKHEEISWTKFPVNRASGKYRRLMATPDGRSAYAVFIGCVRLAARAKADGTIDITADDLSFETGIPVKDCVTGLEMLASDTIGWLVSKRQQNGEQPVSERSQTIPETAASISSLVSSSSSKEAAKDENNPPQETPFEKFWKAWPKHFRKSKKPDALKAWKKHGCDDRLPVILKKIAAFKKSRQWADEDGKFIPFPSSWINDQPWDDDDPPRNEALWGPAKTPEQIRADKQMLADTFGWPKEAREREGLQ